MHVVKKAFFCTNLGAEMPGGGGGRESFQDGLYIWVWAGAGSELPVTKGASRDTCQDLGEGVPGGLAEMTGLETQIGLGPGDIPPSPENISTPSVYVGIQPISCECQGQSFTLCGPHSFSL